MFAHLIIILYIKLNNVFLKVFWLKIIIIWAKYTWFLYNKMITEIFGWRNREDKFWAGKEAWIIVIALTLHNAVSWIYNEHFFFHSFSISGLQLATLNSVHSLKLSKLWKSFKIKFFIFYTLVQNFWYT